MSGDTDENYEGCYAWVSFDGVSYEKISSLIAPNPTGVLSEQLPSGSNPDLINMLHVTLSDASEQLYSVSENSWDDLTSLCYVDGELIAYQYAQFIEAGKYILSNLYRGCYGTANTAHAQNSQFAYLGDGEHIFKMDYMSRHIGKTIHIKLQAQTTDGVQDISTCAAYQYTLTGNPG